jgi:small subunit ribosomal protein S8
MSMSDPISDMLTRIRNAAAAGLPAVEMPSSRMRGDIARILKQEGVIADVAVAKDPVRPTMTLSLKYVGKRRPVIRGLRRISKPGLRRYAGATEMPRVVGGTGVAIVTTSRGVMTDREARRAKVGGEILCYVW